MNRLNYLCERLGIWNSFNDRGCVYETDARTKKILCQSLGYPADTSADIQSSLTKLDDDAFSQFVPFVRIVREWELSPFCLEIIVPFQENEQRVLSWFLTCEEGQTLSGQQNLSEATLVESRQIGDKVFAKFRIYFVLEDVPLGYHSMTFLLDDQKPETNSNLKLIVVPYKCYMPESLEKGYRSWGIPLQLYALSSQRNWGMGDFTDLRNFQTVAARLQASLVGINPLNALFPDSPQDASPYFSSSRLFLNPLYIDIDEIPESNTTTAYSDYLKSSRFIELMTASKSSDLVEYEYIAEMKYAALNIVYDAFKKLHLDANYQPITQRGEKFIEFVHKADPYLTRFATFHVLRSYFLSQNKTANWKEWDDIYRSSNTSEIRLFQKKHADSIWFIYFQQFIAFEQFDEVRLAYNNANTPIGLYTDLPVGVSQNSAEVWANQDLFLDGVSIGAPPDDLNPKGQDWSLAAFNPITLKKTGYDFFIHMLRAVMRPAGALRIDHAFSFMRLFLRVKNGSGAYLSYPFDDMLGILALESVRNHTLIIGEDIGTVPPGFMEKMAQADVLSFRILHYQKHGDFLMNPHEYEHRCLVVAGTHDMPTYAAYWMGQDLDLKRSLKIVSEDRYQQDLSSRKKECQAFMDAFISEGLISQSEKYEIDFSNPVLPNWFIPKSYQFLARSNSILLMVRLEDILEQVEQVNVPGTYLNYPNWRYKLPILMENLLTDERVISICEMIRKERPIPD